MQDLMALYFFSIGFFNFPIWGASPPDFEVCNAGNETCLVDIIQVFFHKGKTGIPELGIPPFEPMNVDKMVWAQSDSDNPINIKITWTHVSAYNFSKADIISVKGFGINPHGKHSINFVIPESYMTADYEVIGDIFGLPVNGSGFGKSGGKYVNTTVVFEANSVTTNGSVYLNVTSVILSINFNVFYIDLPNYYPEHFVYNSLIGYLMNFNRVFVGRQIKCTAVAAFNDLYYNVFHQASLMYPYSELVIGGL